ncbi:hypothetical protein PV377_45865 [Streptomyces ipomoeae]|uniref:hypothetical protein n=1 Tax=Streptomyces ipomoeae TaxID=103232 RepID=UPI0029BC870E|nr:hypothetical protein [Streptomyces ipomoeae]MDX2846162.1 hypothetical protein [Streptomyces ipomoeae]
MSNPTVTAVPLPAPLRILTADEYDRAVKAGVRAARSVARATVEEVTDAVLTEFGLFSPPIEPDELDPEFCTAQGLTFDPQTCDAHALGQWHQCGDEPGHVGDIHDNGEFTWRDGQPGTVTARHGAA